MEFLRDFFRAKEDGFIFPMYGKIHILILIIFIIGIYIIYKGYFGLKRKETNRKFINILLFILLIDQIILYLWQVGSGYFNWAMSLPLYHCRICVWFLIIGIYFENSFFKTLGLYWGALGSTLAMLVPDLYNFSFPHFTNIQFFVVHVLMGWVITDLIFREKYIPNKSDNIKSIYFTNLFNIVLIMFNLIMKRYWPKINYGYMLELPVFDDLLPSSIQPITMFLMFNFVMLAFSLISKKLNNKREEINEKNNYLY